MSTNIPVVNAGEKYINGLGLVYASDTTFVVSDGQARDSTNTNDISLASTVTVNAEVNGINGLDIGAFTFEVIYAIYVVGDSTNFSETGVVMSLDLDAPTIPAGYDMFRKIGHLTTGKDGGLPLFLSFEQTGLGREREMWWDDYIEVLAGGVAILFEDIDLSGQVPLGLIKKVQLFVVFKPANAADGVNFKVGGGPSTNGNVRLTGSATTVDVGANLYTQASATSITEYRLDVVLSTLDAFIVSYIDSL